MTSTTHDEKGLHAVEARVPAAGESAGQGRTDRRPPLWWRLTDQIGDWWYWHGIGSTRRRVDDLRYEVRHLEKELAELGELESDLMRATFELYLVFSTREVERAMRKRPRVRGTRSP